MFEPRGAHIMLMTGITGIRRQSDQVGLTSVTENFVGKRGLKIVTAYSAGTVRRITCPMVKLTVKFMSLARMRAGTGCVKFASTGHRLIDVLKEIVDAYGIADIILADNGEVRPWARVLVNGRSHEFVGGLDTELSDDDRIALIYPYTENF